MFSIARLAALTLAVAIVAAPAAAQQTRVPAALAQAVAVTQQVKTQYAFDFDLNSSQQTWRTHFDPNATPRLRLLDPRPETLSGGQRRAFDGLAEQMEGVSWCAGENMVRVDNIRLLREDGETATYAFQPTRESIRSESARRYADRLRGELTITKANPDITRMRIFTPEGFSPAPLVRVENINISIECAPAPNGRRYASQTTMQVRGNALGQTFDERSVQRASNLRAPS